jgi:hypothetical protein
MPLEASAKKSAPNFGVISATLSRLVKAKIGFHVLCCRIALL